MNVLAKVFDHSGSHYHRIKNPLSLMDNINVQFTTEHPVYKDLENVDIYMINSYESANASILTAFKKRLGFKIIVDVDDYWVIHKSHPLYDFYKKNNYINTIVLPNIRAADLVITSNERLAKEIKPINNNVEIVKNSLNYKEPQFSTKKIKSDLLRIIYSTSLSHITDIVEFYNQFKKINKDKNIKKYLEFILSGYSRKDKNTELLWNKFYELFSSHGCETKIIEHLPFNEYLLPLDYSDISIAPLENNIFNYYKSSLKAVEAGSKFNCFITNHNYTYKELEKYIIITTDLHKELKFLSKNKNKVLDYGIKLHEHVINNYDIYKQNEIRYQIFSNINSYNFNYNKNIKIYSITYGNSLDIPPIEYDNIYHNNINTIENKSYLFEYNPIMDIFKDELENNDKINDDYIGIFSWKFYYKTNILEKDIHNIINKNKNYDVYIFSKNDLFKSISYLEFTKIVHPNIEELLKILCKKLNLKLDISPNKVVYSNFFIAKKDIYIRYIKEVVIPCINLMETELKDIAWKDSHYKNLEPSVLKDLTGLNYYPLHTFALERMFSIWLSNNNNINTFSVT